MKLIKETILYKKIDKEFIIETDSGQELKLIKWWTQDDFTRDYDNDYEFDKPSQEIYDNLSDEEKDKISDFIFDL